MIITKLLKTIGKNALVFLAGAIIGLVITVIFIVPVALEKSVAGHEPGAVIAGAIALTPVFVIIYGFLGSIAGGFSSVVIYNVIKLILKKRK